MAKLWNISLHGKWGGVRTITVSARTEAQARREARALMRSDESIRSVHEQKGGAS